MGKLLLWLKETEAQMGEETETEDSLDQIRQQLDLCKVSGIYLHFMFRAFVSY